MNLSLHLCVCLLPFILLLCYGYPDVPYFYGVPFCADRIEDRDSVPFYDFDKPSPPFEKRSEPVYLPDISTPAPILNSGSWKDFISKNEDIHYVTLLSSPQTIYKPNLNRKRRSTSDVETMLEGDLGGYQGNSPALLPTFMRVSETKDNIRTIRLPTSFTPRLGRKRSGEKLNIPQEADSFQTGGISGGYPRVINLSAGNAFTPRLGRSDGTARIHLNAGNAFTPRLGRSEGFNKIHRQAGNAFTPRLGGSENPNRIHLNVGTAFTPRLGRSENPNKIQLNAGSAFTPRLGRSEHSDRISLNAGDAFTPRLG